MYCLDDNLNVIRGAHASVRGCPGDIATFVAQNPALFRATGYAHHPYALLTPPSVRSKNADWVSMGDLRALSRELTRIYRRYGQKTQSKRGVPLYLTEYGYQTRPDPVTRVPFSKQAAWINEAEYIAYRNPNVRAVNQFLLVDDAPIAGEKNPRLAYRTFQSGLQLLTGKRKPSYNAYVTPLFLKQSRVRRGRSVGDLRCPAAGGAREPRSSPSCSSARAARSGGRRASGSPSAARGTTSRRACGSRPAARVRISWQNGARKLVSRIARGRSGPLAPGARRRVVAWSRAAYGWARS